MKNKMRVQVGLLIFGALLIATGIYRNEVSLILKKAINL